MIDPFAIVSAVATLAAAIVLGSGVLVWYTRDALAPARKVRLAPPGRFVGIGGCLCRSCRDSAGCGWGRRRRRAEPQAFSVNGSVIGTFLLKTGVGRIAIIEIGCAVAACIPAVIAWVTLKKSSTSDLALLSAALDAGLGLAAFPFNSHPVTLDQQIAGLSASIAHRLALGVWLGGLPALILLIGAGPVPDDTRRLAAVILRRFSRLAIVAMSVILVSGTLLTWYLVGNFPSLIGTEYGRLLILKLALLGGICSLRADCNGTSCRCLR